MATLFQKEIPIKIKFNLSKQYFLQRAPDRCLATSVYIWNSAYIRFQIFTPIRFSVFFFPPVMASCFLVAGYQRFKGTFCHTLLPFGWRHYIIPRHLNFFTRAGLNFVFNYYGVIPPSYLFCQQYKEESKETKENMEVYLMFIGPCIILIFE